jgi:selenocysteine lyase/cysteine desulfurase
MNGFVLPCRMQNAANGDLMNLNRRDLLAGLGGLAASAGSGAVRAAVPETAPAPNAGAAAPNAAAPAFPRKADFMIEDGYTYINAAYTHPIPTVALQAVQQAAERRASLRAGGRRESESPRADPKALFAELIGAKASEIAYVPSTSFGENLVVQSLGLHKNFDGNVVSDGLHFEGALMHLLELKKRGLDVRIVKPTPEFRIDMKDLEKVVDKHTRLIEVSSVAMYNGFQHDLKAVADLAHAHGAYVYADIIHSAGAGPFDIRASGVDFAACSSFKWLMGDFGMGFLYAREGALDKLDRPVVGYYEADNLEAFYPPNLPAGEYRAIAYEFDHGTHALFEPGTLGGGTNVALIGASLNYIKTLGLANIQAHRQPLLRRLQQEVPRFGFTPVTPPESTSGNLTFAKQGVYQTDLPKRLEAMKINIRFSRHWIRLSPSVYNDMSDIDRFLAALS